MERKNLCVLAIALCAAVAALQLLAAIIPVAPEDCGRIALLTAEQKDVMAHSSYEGRLAELKADRAGPGRYFSATGDKWRVSAPLVFKWVATNGEKGPWLVRLGRSHDLVGAKEFWIAVRDVQVRKVGEGENGVEYSFIAPRPNLELGREYFWRVWSNVKCPKWGHGSTLSADCPCGKGPKASASPVWSFVTEDAAPRWIKLEGRVANIRDLGGWRTEDGRRVRQGMVYRGQGLNDNSVNGDAIGRSRLMSEDVAYMTGELGIKTDLDLRTEQERSAMSLSPLGPGVKLVARSSPCYKTIFDDGQGVFAEGSGKKVMAKNFRVFCNPANYPIYFHCIGGADRTGSLAFILNGVLGVSRHDLEVDWESTFYPELPEMSKDYMGPDYWRRGEDLSEGILKYGGKDASWRERVELYLLDCGVTRDEIERFRSIMLEPSEAAVVACAPSAPAESAAETLPLPPKAMDVVANVAAVMEAKVFKGAGGGLLRYRIFSPATLKAGRKYPLVLFLHGSGERGDDNAKQLLWGVWPIISYMKQKGVEGYVVAPQCPLGKMWVDITHPQLEHKMPANPSEPMYLVMEFLDNAIRELPVDAGKVRVTGLSMGGYGTWDIVQRRPDFFAAAMPVCGGGDISLASKIRSVPIWVFHGCRDGSVPVARSRQMVSALWQCDGNVRYREYPSMGHRCWIPTYDDSQVLDWFFSQSRPQGQ